MKFGDVTVRQLRADRFIHKVIAQHSDIHMYIIRITRKGAIVMIDSPRSNEAICRWFAEAGVRVSSLKVMPDNRRELYFKYQKRVTSDYANL
jgi:hypothetical protein